MNLARWTSRQRRRQNQHQSRRLGFDGRRCAGRCGSARRSGGLRRFGGPARAGGRQASGPKTVAVRGHASGRRQDRTGTAKPVRTIFFKIDVGFAGQVWSSQVREAKSRCQVKRAGRLLGMRELCSRATPPLPRTRALGRRGRLALYLGGAS